jgi:hypothetical protein
VLLYRRIRYGYAFRRIPLTQGKYAIVDPDDYYWLSKHKWTASRVYTKFYAVRSELCKTGGKRKSYRMHREVAHTPDGLECDHINGNSLDNRKANLRSATRQQNCWNSSKRRTGLSKYKGVSRNKRGRPWKAQLIVDGKRMYFGCFDDQIEAAKAYDKAARKYYGDFAALNFPMSPSR